MRALVLALVLLPTAALADVAGDISGGATVVSTFSDGAGTVYGEATSGGLVSWYDVSDAGSVTGTAPISNVRDKAGSNDLSATVGGFPDFTGGWLVFDGTEDVYATPAVTDYPFTVICVFRAADSTTGYGRQVLWGYVDASEFDHQLEGLADGSAQGNPGSCYAREGATTAAAKTTARSGYYCSVPHVLTVIATSATSRTVYIDNAGGHTETTSVALSGIDRFGVAAELDVNPAAYFDGEIGEIRVYDSALNATRLAEISAALSAKWGASDGELTSPAWPYTTNLIHRWTADAGVTGTDPVTLWADQVGSADLAAGTGPALVTTVNTRQGLQFVDTSSEYLEYAGAVRTAAPFSVVAWHYGSANDAAAYLSVNDGDSASDFFELRTETTSATMQWWIRDTSTQLTVDVTSAWEASRVGFVIAREASSTSHRIGGTDGNPAGFNEDTESTTSKLPNAANLNTTTVGRRTRVTTGHSGYLNMTVMGIAIYDASIPTSANNQILHWLETYYGVGL